MGGKVDAAYHREYRRRIKADPERAAKYRAAHRARSQRLRAIPGWRAAHEPEHRNRTAPPMPDLHQGHPVLDQARAAIPKRAAGRLVAFADEVDADDARSEYVLALLEGRDPTEAVMAFRSRQRAWRSLTAPLLDDRLAA